MIVILEQFVQSSRDVQIGMYQYFDELGQRKTIYFLGHWHSVNTISKHNTIQQESLLYSFFFG